MLINILLLIHIISGFTALLSGLLSISNKLFKCSHRWHIRFGKLFYYAMCLIAITALLLAVISKNVFLLLITFFSFYFVYAGLRHARKRTENIEVTDRLRIAMILFISTSMCIYGLIMLLSQNPQGTTLIVFALVGCLTGYQDLKASSITTANTGKRIQAHLSFMIAAFIATLTAFLVTNFETSPEFILWLAPTFIFTPLIIWFNKRFLE